MTRRAILLLLLVLPLGAQTAIPTPAEHLGFEPGTDRRLADYGQVYSWFEKLAAASDRVEFSSIGETTGGNAMGLAIISSPANLANLDEIRRTNLALVDPRRLKPGDAERLVARGKTIVSLNASIHSIEVGPTQATLPLAHFLATTQDPGWLRVLDDVVLLMLPCHNPDGYQKQVEWYRKWVGTPHEGCALPGLYHPYAGHDNNRDWFMFNLKETRITVKEIYLRWVPQIVMDSHQMAEDGARMFIPPYMDPIEPNVDPILIERLNDLGLTVQEELLAEGLTGIVNRSIFDAWSPSRAYMHYHGGVRFLCEIASCRQATPIEKKGLDRRATTRPDINPVPWKGDRWALSDVVRYHNQTAKSVLRHASRNRERWLRSFHQVFRKACASTEEPEAIEARLGVSGLSVDKFRDVLAMGGIESWIHNGGDPWSSRLDTHVVIPRQQPFFGFVRALMTTSQYPLIRETETGPVRRPYDVTAHSIPLLMDFEAWPSKAPPWPHAGRSLELPSIDVPLKFPSLDDGAPAFFANGDRKAIAIYRTFVTNAVDEGWTRLFLGISKVPHHSLENRDLQEWTDAGKPKVLIFPSLTADLILNGNRGEQFPPEYRGGLGELGIAWIVRFVHEGGTLIALKDASALPIQVFRLPLRNALAMPREDGRAYVPGAMLRVDLDPEHPWRRYPPLFVTDLGVGKSSKAFSALFEGGKAFEPDLGPDRDQGRKPVVVARWAPAKSLLMAGYAEGLDLIAGKAAIVQCDVGKGQVILFGFSPQFRCQTWGTFPLLRNAIASGLERN